MIIKNGKILEKEYSESLEYVHIIKSSANILQFIVKDLIDLMQIKQQKFNA
jgi:hypothetical protein